MRREFELSYGGARFGGKTDAGLAWLVEPDFIKHPRYSGLVLRKNHTDLSDWIERSKYAYQHLGMKITGNSSTGTILRFPSGAFIRTGHLKEEDAYEKYQGHEYHKMLIEELTQIPYEAWYEKVLSSCRCTVEGLYPQCMTNWNPGGPGHLWVKRRFFDVAFNKPYLTNPDDPPEEHRWRIFIQAKVQDNPVGCKRDPGYVATLKAIKDPKLRAAWLEGRMDVFIGQYFEKWNQALHVLPADFPLKNWWNRYRFLDWGYSSPGYVGWGAIDDVGNHYIYRELKFQQAAAAVVARNVLSMTPGSEQIINTIADPSIWAKTQYGEYAQESNRSISHMLSDAGLFCVKGNNDRINGWMRMKELMYWDDQGVKPRLFVLDNCEYFKESIPTLVHDDKRPEDLDTNGEDHPADATRYWLMHTTGFSQRQPAPRTELETEFDKLWDPVQEHDWAAML
jgi:hypothetical protein